MNTVNLVKASRIGWFSYGQLAPTLMRVLRTVVCLMGLTLAEVRVAMAQEAAEASAIPEVYAILLEAVGKSAADIGIGWALSSIGLAGEESGDFDAIAEELQKIDADLKNINNTLNQILNAIETQTCTQAQIAPSLQNAVNDVTELYNEYRTYVTNAARIPPVPPSQTQVLAWQQGVLARIAGDLNDIHNGVYATVTANVITQCAIATAEPYLQAAKTATTFFDDRPSYAQLVNIVNYYYGIYVQGATILTEAYHLQACQFAAQNDPNLHCDFTTASSSTSASKVNTICNAPTDIDVQRACLAAEETITNPDTGAGLYERIAAWLKAAGAPYATDQLGILSSIGSDTSNWDANYAYLFPRDLLDFTNHATIDGETVSNCSSPLTSAAPCGLTVGRYDMALSSQLSYGGISGHWQASSTEVLLLLVAPYNAKRFGDTSSTLGNFMASIGFSDSLQNGGLIVTTANTGKNGVTGSQAICFMDTASPRDTTKQPFCDSDIGKEDHQGTDKLIHHEPNDNTKYVEQDWTKALASNPSFYTAKWIEGAAGKIWQTSPGWLVSAQQNPGAKQTIFWQYHWPMTNVPEISCQKGKPYLNPGGLLSRCAGDLQEYVDAFLPPPDSNTIVLAASGDVTLLEDQPNRNTGEDLLLADGSLGADEFAVQFADERYERFLAGGEIYSAILRLSLADQDAPRNLEIVPLSGGFVEGKGVGTGATWNCAEDADLSDDSEDCFQQWPASRFAHEETRQPDHLDHVAGLIGFDVTEDVAAGITAWLIRLPSHGASNGAYHSREGALTVREPWRAPTLLIRRWATATVTRFAGKAEKVGSGTNNARLQVSGKVEGVGPLTLNAATLKLSSVLREIGGTEELLYALSGPLLPLQLMARRGSTARQASFETSSRVTPKIQAEFKQRDPRKDELEFRIKIEGAGIKAAQLCGSPWKGSTSLQSAFTLTDGMHGAAVRTMQPWQCKQGQLKAP